MAEPVSEALSPSNAALLLIDHQVGTMNFGITDLSAMELKNQTLLLAESARAFGLPVILTASNPNGPNGPVFPEVLAALPEVPVIERVRYLQPTCADGVDVSDESGRRCDCQRDDARLGAAR